MGHKRDNGPCTQQNRQAFIQEDHRALLPASHPGLQHQQALCDEVAEIPSKRLRNKIAGFTTHMMKRIARGPVKGISLKLQEEEREKRLDYIPDISAVDLEIEKGIEIDADTKNMLRAMDMQNLPGLNVVSNKDRRPYGDRPPRSDRPPRPQN